MRTSRAVNEARHATHAGVPLDVERRTTCCYCGVGCGIVVGRDSGGRLSLRGDESHPVNRGMLCSKGRTLLHVVRDRERRLLVPGRRRRLPAEGQRGPLEACTWDTALGEAAERLRRIIDRHGPRSVAIYASGQMLTEEYYLANKLMKGGIGANNIDTNSRLCMSSAVMGYKLALGSDGPPTSYADIECCDTFFVAGANPAWCHPILFRRLEARLREEPAARLVVVDPRRTATADLAHLHLALRPGTDLTLFRALARWLIVNDQIDADFVREGCVGFDELAAAVEPCTLAHAAAVCDLRERDIQAAAELLAGDRRFLSLWTMGLNQSASGTAKNLALINLSLLTGKIGRPGCGPFSLTGQPNAMGGREVGGMATLLAAHRDLADPSQRAEVARFWGVESIDERPGLTAVECFDALADGRLKAIWIIATNPAASLPASRRVAAALRRAELVIAQDCYPTDTTDLADIVLPAATWLEKTGTMTNAERRITLLEPVLDPPGEARSDVWIMQQMGRRLGCARLVDFPDESAIFAEHAALTAGRDIDISGLDYERLRAGSVQWPWSPADPERTGAARLYRDRRFATPDGRARLHATPATVESEAVDSRYPFVLTTGRLRDQWHTMTKTGGVAKLRAHEPTPFVEVHPEDAAALEIGDGAMVDVTSRRGSLRVAARITDRIRRGVVFVPMHWGRRLGGSRGRSNAPTSPILDPISHQPDLKYAAVAITAYRPPHRLIRIVGAGAAALALVEALRRQGSADEIHIHGEEPEAIYDRVLLPHYIDGSLDWPELVRADRAALARQRAVYHGGARVVAIDRARRCIRDDEGRHFDYDLLVLATGSRPARPRIEPLPQAGMYTLRRRRDADQLRARVAPGSRVVVVGGGLLGLELADALRVRGAEVTVLNRSARLMSRQLDLTASQLLVAELRRRGIAVELEAAVAAVAGAEVVDAVTLVDGRVLACDTLVFATGTEPNAELGHAAGLAGERGIAVDEHLRTADRALFAIGEVAEIGGRCYGTSAIARDQAEALADYLRGNEHAPYRGSVAANILKLHDYQLASAGRVEAAEGDEIVTFSDPALGRYQRVLIRDDRLVGVILVGDTSRFAEYRDLIASGTELEDQRSTLLAPGAGAEPVRGRLVCSCNRIGEATIRDAISAGADAVDAVAAATRAGTACGSCRSDLQRLLDERAVAAVGSGAG